jgi:hypothetical protein
MALCKDVFGLLQDLMALSEAEPETYCDFRVHCKDGVVEIPKLIVQVCKNNYICIDRNSILSFFARRSCAKIPSFRLCC